MKYSTASILMTILTAGFMPTQTVAQLECDSMVNVKCTVIDNRASFQEWKGKPCKKFAREYRIDLEKVKNRTYDGVNTSQGFPLLEVRYDFVIGDNNDGTSKTLLTSGTKTVVDGVVLGLLDTTGRMNTGVVRRGAIHTVMNTTHRNHKAISQLQGFLVTQNDGVLDGTNGSEKVECEASKVVRTRLTYSDDCKVEANTSCALSGTDKKCEDTVLKLFENDCKEYDVDFIWEICNRETSSIVIDTKKSKRKFKNKKVANLPSTIPPGCTTYIKPDTINTCMANTSKSLNLSIRGSDNFKTCRAYSAYKFDVVGAFPSASPTESPTVSVKPSPSPTISHKPTISFKPTQPPSSSPSKAPTKRPSASPSSRPTSSPSMAPSSNPSVSMKPTSSPSAGPTVSTMPSCVPSASPSVSVNPSSTPSSIPTTSKSPSASPSVSKQPSNSPSDKPSSSPSVSNAPTKAPTPAPTPVPTPAPTSYPTYGKKAKSPKTRALKSKSNKAPKSPKGAKETKSTKSDKSKKNKNACQS